MDAWQREQFIKQHVDLVRYIVGRIAISLPPNVDRDDLISAGIVGLIKAVDRFDPSRGVKFETYANSVIRGEIMESLRSRDWAPRSLRRRARKVAEVVAELESEIGQIPTDAEIAAALNMDIEEYYELMGQISGASISSLEDMVAQHPHWEPQRPSSGEAADVYRNPVEHFEQNELRQFITDVIDELPPREKHIIALYYQEELTLREIGKILDISESRVCQIHSQTITRLRARLLKELG